MLTKKIPPTTGDQKVDAAFRQLYNDVNELIERLNAVTSSPEQTSSGIVGEIRVVKAGQTGYQVQIKHSDGWLITDEGVFKSYEGGK